MDVVHDKVVGEALDLQHGAAFAKHIVVTGSSDYAISANSDVVVLTAGVRQRVGESRLDLVGRNFSVLKCKTRVDSSCLGPSSHTNQSTTLHSFLISPAPRLFVVLPLRSHCSGSRQAQPPLRHPRRLQPL